jgi:hypothetical protein
LKIENLNLYYIEELREDHWIILHDEITYIDLSLAKKRLKELRKNNNTLLRIKSLPLEKAIKIIGKMIEINKDLSSK